MGGLVSGGPPWVALYMVRIAPFLRSVGSVGVLVSGGPGNRRIHHHRYCRWGRRDMEYHRPTRCLSRRHLRAQRGRACSWNRRDVGYPRWAVLCTARIALFRRCCPCPVACCPIGHPRVACGVVPVLSCAPPSSRASASELRVTAGCRALSVMSMWDQWPVMPYEVRPSCCPRWRNWPRLGL